MLASVKPGLIAFEMQRSALWNQPAPDPEFLARGIELAVSYPRRRVPDLSLSDLTAFQAVVSGSEEASLRGVPAQGKHASEAAPAEMVSRALARLFEWIGSEAFAELHPVEQMTICQARLAEIAPFERFSNSACDLFSFLILTWRGAASCVHSIRRRRL